MKNLISIKNYKFFQYIFTQRGEHYEEPEQFAKFGWCTPSPCPEAFAKDAKNERCYGEQSSAMRRVKF